EHTGIRLLLEASTHHPVVSHHATAHLERVAVGLVHPTGGSDPHVDDERRLLPVLGSGRVVVLLELIEVEVSFLDYDLVSVGMDVSKSCSVRIGSEARPKGSLRDDGSSLTQNSNTH